MTLTVHDFWTADHDTACAMLAFIGRHNARAETIDFRRGALPPFPDLLHTLHRFRPTAQAWHPWMLRILDVEAALGLRGCPADLEFTTTVEITAPGATDRYRLHIADGSRGGRADDPRRRAVHPAAAGRLVRRRLPHRDRRPLIRRARTLPTCSPTSCAPRPRTSRGSLITSDQVARGHWSRSPEWSSG